MSEYRDELIEEAKAGSEKILEASSQIDVTSTGNYAATWMKQDEQLGTSKKREVDRIAEANEAMAEIWSSQYEGGEWTGLDAQATEQDPSSGIVGYEVPIWDDSGLFGEPEMYNQKIDKSMLDGMFERYVDQGGSQDVVDMAKETQAYQATNLPELATSDQPKAEFSQKTEVASAPQPSVEKLEAAVAQNQKKPVSPPKQEPQAEVDSSLTKTQREAKSRGDALRARQARAQEIPEMDGEASESRQPNFRAGATAMNASVDNFATTTADHFETSAQALAMATARIRALERIIREASR